MAPPRDSAVEDVAEQSENHERTGDRDTLARLIAYMGHCEEYRYGAAAPVGQREEVGQMKRAEQRKMPARRPCIWNWTMHG
jgi:hypothetical protein